MQDLDNAFKTALTLQPNCWLDLLFGKERNVVFGYKLVLEKFKKEINMLKETSIVQTWLDERYRDGKSSGKLEGKLEGKIEGKRMLLETLLTQKFGKLSSDLLLKLQLSSNEQLDRLGTVFLHLNSIDELQAWLSNGASGHGLN